LFESLVMSVHIPLQQLSVLGESLVVTPQVHCPFTQLWPLAQQVSVVPLKQHWLMGQQTPPQQPRLLSQQRGSLRLPQPK
jgi:hypothetical protein